MKSYVKPLFEYIQLTPEETFANGSVRITGCELRANAPTGKPAADKWGSLNLSK